MTVHVITGATGFVGGALTLELIRDPDAVVHLVVRGRDSGHAIRRACAFLSAAATAYGVPAAIERVHPLHGDVSLPLCGIGDLPDRVDLVWHCAATLHYEEHRAAEIAAVNHLGTHNVIALAERLGAELNHVSTAYIAPRDKGRLVEAPATGPGPSEAATPYHHAKARAEQDVVACGLPWRILRPPFVVGHSATHAATHFAGFYAMARRLRNARLTDSSTMDVPEAAEINMMPVDVLVRAAVAVGTTGPTGTVYHLTNSAAPRSRTVLDCLFTWCGLSPPSYRTGTGDGPPTVLRPYFPYFDAGEFDRASTERVVGPHGLSAPLDVVDLHRFLDAYRATLLAC